MGVVRSLTVLLLEDQALVRAGMRALIQISEPTAQIEEASSYEEAIIKFDTKTFHIAFLDIDLKNNMSGLDVLKYIREREVDTRAIMLSGASDKSTVMNCIQEGASGFILKNADNNGVFRRALDAVFQGSIFLPATVLGKGGFTPSHNPKLQMSSPQELGITGRSLEVLYYLCQGLPNKVIANKMGIEEGTIRRDYVPRLFKTLKVARRTELIIEVARRGIAIPTPPLSQDRAYLKPA